MVPGILARAFPLDGFSPVIKRRWRWIMRQDVTAQGTVRTSIMGRKLDGGVAGQGAG
jgi:hypothetical protein